MSESDSLGSLDSPFDAVVERFLEEVRAGRDPDIEEYVAGFPERPEALREVLAAAGMMEAAGGSMAAGDRNRITRDGSMLERLGEYRILREIGRGGMGVVYEAVQESLGRHVALKVLPFYATLDRRRVERFRAEARAVGGLHHPHIVPVHGVGEENGICFYAMQFIDGQPLHRVLLEVQRLRTAPARKGGEGEAPASPRGAATASTSLLTESSADGHSPAYYRHAARIGLQVAEALAHAHREGILHRDIKPANLLLAAGDHVWVADFGLAKATDGGDLTRTGEVVGTLAYLAPECLDGWADPRSEVYSLGATLYEILTLRPLHRDDSQQGLVKRISSEMPLAPRRLDYQIPVDLETIVLKAIEKDPTLRYQSAAALADDLRAYLAGLPVRARRATVPQRIWLWCRRNRGLALASAIAVTCSAAAIVGLFGAWWLRSERNNADYWRTLAEAREYRMDIEPGRKLESAERVREAATILAGLRLDETEHQARRLALRRELIAARAGVDVRTTPVQIGEPFSFPRTLAFGPDCQVYALGDEVGNVRVRSRDTGDELASFAGPEARASFLRISESRRFLAAKFDDAQQRFILWDLASKQAVLEVPHSLGQTFDFTSDDRLLAIATRPPGADEIDIGVYELTGGEPPRRVHPETAAAGLPDAYTLRFDSRGRRLAVSSGEMVRVLDLDDGVRLFDLEHGCHVRGIAWSPDDQLLAAGGADLKVHVWNLATGDKQVECEGHSAEVIHVAFHPDGDLLASSSWDGTVRLWDPYSGNQRVRIPCPEGGWPLLRFSRDGRTITHTRSPEGAALLWEVVRAGFVRSIHGHFTGGKAPRGVAYSPDGRWMASTGEDGLRFWESGSGRQLGFVRMDGAWSVAISAATGEILASSPERVVRFRPTRDSRTAEGLERILLGTGDVLLASADGSIGALALDASGRRLAVTHGRPAHVDVLDLEQAVHHRSLREQPGATHLDISPDGKLIAAGAFMGENVLVWNVDTGELVKTLPPGDRATARFSPDGRLLVVSEVTSYRGWEVGSWSERFSIQRTRCNVPTPTAFSRDGAILAVAQSPETVLLLDPRTGGHLAALEPPDLHEITWMDFSPDGTTLAVATVSHSIWEWELSRIGTELRPLALDWAQLPVQPQRGGPSPVMLDVPLEPPDVEAAVALSEQFHGGYRLLLSAADAESAQNRRARERLRQEWRDLEVQRARWTIQRLVETGRSEDVLRAYDSLLALDLDPGTRGSCLNGLAWLCATGPDEVRDVERAVALATLATESSPGNHSYHNTLGMAYYRAGRPRDAIGALQRSLDLGGPAAENRLILSMCQARLGEGESAQQNLRIAAAWLEAQSNRTTSAFRTLSHLRAEAESLIQQLAEDAGNGGPR